MLEEFLPGDLPDSSYFTDSALRVSLISELFDGHGAVRAHTQELMIGRPKKHLLIFALPEYSFSQFSLVDLTGMTASKLPVFSRPPFPKNLLDIFSTLSS